MHMSPLTIQSSRFGTLEIEADAVLSFPQGLIGLGGTRYALLTTDDESPFAWLHSIEDPELALPITRPSQFFTGYNLVVSDEDADILTLGGDTPVEVWVTVHAAPSIMDFTVNLRAPIVMMRAADGMVAYQVLNEAPDLGVSTPLFSGAAGANGAAGPAGADGANGADGAA